MRDCLPDQRVEECEVGRTRPGIRGVLTPQAVRPLRAKRNANQRGALWTTMILLMPMWRYCAVRLRDQPMTLKLLQQQKKPTCAITINHELKGV